LAIERLFLDVGFPTGVFKTLLITSRSVPAVVANPIVKGVAVTGSIETGRSVASEASKHIKKSVLELGGSDAYIVLADADIEKAAEACVESRLTNAGQSCISATRFIVVKEIHTQFFERVYSKMAGKVAGDPLHPGVDIGPLASKAQRRKLHKQVESSIAKGATLHLGGTIPSKTGAFYKPTLLSQVTRGMPAYDEELFGPVASIIQAEDEQEAIAIANGTELGLGAAVFTSDLDKGLRIASEQLEAGVCFVNDFVKSDPRLPFGGIKHSGYGRELSRLGIREFLNPKTVVLA
jgi:succinate-semialdehyde dehydrogenase/glutarate-semialdehyde dehydrogenase